MGQIKKVVVFTGDLNYAVRKGIVSVDGRLPGLSWLILLHSPHRPLRQALRAQWRNLKRDGWRRIRDIAFTLRDRIRVSSNHPLPAGAPGAEYTIEQLAARPNFQVVRYSSIHSTAAIRAVTRFRPDIGLSLAAPILKKRIFSIPVLGTLNLHKGKLPEYRGMPPAFWELWNGEISVGCTVHWVDERLDAGAVALSSAIACDKYSTMKGLQLRLDELGHELICSAISKINQGASLRTPQEAGGTTYRKPSLRQLDELNRRRRQLCNANAGRAERMLKDTVKTPAVVFGRLVLRRFVPPRITVLLYHRVSDDARDNLTTGVEQFDRQMQLLRRHFEAISLGELLKAQAIPRSRRPLVCVTFDDGYLDNYTHAFPILQRNNVPAAFFVATGLIGTHRQFPHDVRRGNKPIPMMEWAHLVEMHKAGFTIGSHTASHLNCAEAKESRVRAELAESLNEIRSRLGVDEVAFAYPYGGKNDMTKQRLGMVKEIGYVACLSAYGGTNVRSIDRFNVVRRGVHWEFSDTSFLWTALGLV
ncbi:MAG: polysaccharide deacetylase family protein [Acidobacteriaceae bacterium]